jgi:hypothetical protein
LLGVLVGRGLGDSDRCFLFNYRGCLMGLGDR